MDITFKHLPRKGQYEIFIHANVVHCFDDVSLERFYISYDELSRMLNWMRDHIEDGCRRYEEFVWYLTPDMYLLWKLRWAKAGVC
jgi:hypothetical protein